MAKLENIFESILEDSLERSLSLRFDVCTCTKCRKDMMKYLLMKFPAMYLNKDDSEYAKIERNLRMKHSIKILQEISTAIQIVNDNLPHPVEENREESFNNLLSKIKKERGIDFSFYHRKLLKRRVAIRLAANGVKSYYEYLSVLVNNPREYEELFNVLTINVSEFFRDPPVWSAIRGIMMKLIAEHNRQNKPVNIWSAGCAKGEEAYSLAILIREMGDLGIPLKIYATDIDRNSLETARKGVYRPAQVKNVDKESLRQYFVLEKGEYHLKDEIKNMVDVSYLDLTSSFSRRNFDVIICRNVFIYFMKYLQEGVVDKFYKSLNNNGYYIIGKTETMMPESRVIFKEVDLVNRIYQKVKI